MTEARDRSRSPQLPRCTKPSGWWKDFLSSKVKAESQILSVSNALEDAKDERWNPPDSPSRASGYQIMMGTDTYNEFADVLSCQSDIDLKTFVIAFEDFKTEFSLASDANVFVSSERL
jgi:hypothetical protein